MKKFLTKSLILTLFFPFLNFANADEYKFLQGIKRDNTITFYGVDINSNSTILNSYSASAGSSLTIDFEKGIYDEYNGKVYYTVEEINNGRDVYSLEYDLINNTITKLDNAPTQNIVLYPRGVTQLIKENSSDGTIQIGSDTNDVDITAEGISIDGEPLITKKANGELHIGKNSWITKEENGRQKVYAKDASGNPIPIDYTNGTKLLINGRDVEQSINNVGALSAALTGLPTVPTDTTLACGLGTGTHGGDFAFSGGCASKVNEKISINYAASMTMPGQDYAGDFEDQFSARAGFVWKLGKATKPTQISMKETKELKKEISDLKENNNHIISQNKNLQLENQSIISQNNALLARLERLEKVALGDLKSKDLAVYKLK